MRSAKALCRFATVVFGLALPGIALGQTPVPPPAATPASGTTVAPAAGPAPTAEVASPPGLASDYGYPPAYQSGYGYPPPPPESMDGYHVHDGFFLRVQAGIGFSSLSSKGSDGVKTTMGGGGLSFGAAAGGVIARNLVLYGTFFETDGVNPDVQVGGASMASQIAHISLEGMGGGVAYYFQPINLYLSGALALTRFWTYDVNGNQLDTSKIGLGFELQVGKEWWVSRDWGLGVAGQLIAGSMKDQSNPGLSWSAGAFSLLFSATYN